MREREREYHPHRLTDEQRNRVEANLPLALSFARRFYKPGRTLEYADVKSACFAALIAGVRLHDPERGKLSTVVHRWCRAMLQRDGRALRLIHVPSGQVRATPRPGRRGAEDHEHARHALAATFLSLADGHFHPPAPNGDDGPDGDLVRSALSAVDALDPDDRHLVRSILGLDGPQRTSHELGRELGLSPQTVAAKYRLAIRKLKHALGADREAP